MNMRVLRKSRKARRAGDIFAFQIVDTDFMFGRVIKTDARIVSMRDVIMVYIYNARSRAKEDTPVLDRNGLLIPPQLINGIGWSLGYFETIEHRPLSDEDVLDQHCFYSPSLKKGGKDKLFDEYDTPLPRRVEPCGFHGLGNHRTIEDEVCQALGIPLAPD